jgi:hypothetical protein
MNSPELTPAGPRFARRVSSAPTPIIPSRAADSPDHASSSPLVETLIVQPGVKIVQFSTSGQAVLEDVAAARQEAGTWPPWSRTERTIAMGMFFRLRISYSHALTCLSSLSRHLIDLSRSRVRRVPQLRLCAAADSPQEPVLVHRRIECHFRIADTPTELLED